MAFSSPRQAAGDTGVEGDAAPRAHCANRELPAGTGRRATRPGGALAISVRLFPRLEMVGLACLDAAGGHLGGARFDEFARSRTRHVFSSGKLNDGVVFTLFIPQTRVIQVMVKAVAPARDAWVVVEERLKSPPPLSPARAPLPARTSASSTSTSTSTTWAGPRRTRSSRPASSGTRGSCGPIVWNTFDQAASFTERDPDNLDGRSGRTGAAGRG